MVSRRVERPQHRTACTPLPAVRKELAALLPPTQIAFSDGATIELKPPFVARISKFATPSNQTTAPNVDGCDERCGRLVRCALSQ